MNRAPEHPGLATLKKQHAEGRVERREFLRTATLLGLSAAAYAVTGVLPGEHATAAMPSGGHLRLGMKVLDVSSPHTIDRTSSSNIGRQVAEYLTVTGHDNITRPLLLESWSPSPDLKTWTLRLRRDVSWHSGRPFVADDVVWNIMRVLDESIGSSVLGLMKGYLTETFEADGESHTRLWDADAIERVDSHTVLLTEAQGLIDVEQRRAVMARIEQLMQEDGPIVQPLWRSELTFMDRRVKGFAMHPTTYIFGNELALEP